MKEVSAKCSKCQTKLLIKFQDNETSKQIICPICGHVFIAKIQSAVVTPPDDGETQLCSSPISGSQNNTRNVCSLIYNNKTYYLQHGCNMIGRKAQSSHANIQIDTDDKYMSRQHAIINVYDMPDGSLKAVMNNSLNKNSTQINGLLLGMGDEVVLHDGMSIVMGHSTLTFSMKKI